MLYYNGVIIDKYGGGGLVLVIHILIYKVAMRNIFFLSN